MLLNNTSVAKNEEPRDTGNLPLLRKLGPGIYVKAIDQQSGNRLLDNFKHFLPQLARSAKRGVDENHCRIALAGVFQIRDVVYCQLLHMLFPVSSSFGSTILEFGRERCQVLRMESRGPNGSKLPLNPENDFGKKRGEQKCSCVHHEGDDDDSPAQPHLSAA